MLCHKVQNDSLPTSPKIEKYNFGGGEWHHSFGALNGGTISPEGNLRAAGTGNNRIENNLAPALRCFLPSQKNKIFHWVSIVALVGLGMAAIYLANQTRQANVMVMAPTITPTITPTQILPTVTVDLPEMNSGTSLAGVTRTAQLHTYRPDKPRFAVTEYTVQPGDSAYSIAQKFNIKPETLLWGNEGMNPDAGALRVNARLNILPVNGVLHIVKAGDTLQKLQDTYGVSIEDIVNFPGNHFNYEVPDQLTPGDEVIIPNGKSQVSWQEPSGPQVVLAVKGGAPAAAGVNPFAFLYKGYFSWPVFPVIVTQPFWSGHGGIDIGLYVRQPVFAAASGTVVFADWDTTGFGNLVIIDHGNGILTYYGHNSALLVRYGQVVGRGEQIAEGGSTGNSTGPHVDFRIKLLPGGYVNPADYLP